MDCSEFRRRLLIDPGAPELAAAANACVCPDAPARLAEALAFEHELGRALEAPIPADLVNRVLKASRDPDEAAPAPSRWRAFALAASLLVAVGAGALMWMSPISSPTDELVLASVQHVAHEPFALTRTDIVPQPLVARMFADAGLRVDDGALGVSYLNRCPLGKRLSVHMVMPAKEGPVTVLYVPDETQVERMDTRAAMVAVRTLPFANGALVLLAESNHDFDRIESAWHAAAGKGVEPVVVAGGL